MAFPTAVKRLQTELIDVLRGYDEALKDATDKSVAELCRQLVDLRIEAIAEIRNALTTAGEEGDEQGSFMSLVHRAVVSMRATVSGLGPGSLQAFANGEARILLAYNDAIDECRSHPEIARLLERQRAALADMVARMNRSSVD